MSGIVTDLYDPPKEFDSLGHNLLGTGRGFSLWHQAESARHHITATADNGIVGHFYWRKGDGRILGVHVHPSFQRRGLATMMYDSARDLSSREGFAGPVHSDNKTQDGESWAAAVDRRTSATKSKPKTPKVRKPEEVWYDVHKHPEGTPGGMGKAPEHHLRNRGWSGHEINEGSGKKTIQYRNLKHPDFVVSYGGGTGTKPDHNFRVLYMGINKNIPRVTRAYSVAEAMNKVEELHGLHNGLVVQPITHGASVADSWEEGDASRSMTDSPCETCYWQYGLDDSGPEGHLGLEHPDYNDVPHEYKPMDFSDRRYSAAPSLAQQPNVAKDKTFVAPAAPPSQQDMTDHDMYPIGPPKPEFPTKPDREHDWPKKQQLQLKEIADPPKPAKYASIYQVARRVTWEDGV